MAPGAPKVSRGVEVVVNAPTVHGFVPANRTGLCRGNCGAAGLRCARCGLCEGCHPGRPPVDPVKAMLRADLPRGKVYIIII